MSWAAVASIGVGLLTADSGGSKSESTTKTMDPRMDPYVFGGAGQTGLLQQGQSLLNHKMAPGGMPGYQMMQDRGMSLLGGSVAGNPFSGGYKGGTNFGMAPGVGNGLGQYTPPPMPPQQAAPQSAGPSMDDILAELKRRQQAASQANSNGGYSGAGGYGNDGGY